MTLARHANPLLGDDGRAKVRTAATLPTGPSRRTGDEPPADLGPHVLRRTVSKRTFQHQQEIANAAAEFGRLPDRDEAIHAIMRGNFHGWDLVPAILRLAAPEVIQSLYVATLGFNTQNARELLELLDAGQVQSVVFLCSCYFQKACPREFEILRAGLAVRRQTVVATRTHAKILAAELTDGRQIVVESSANLRSCRNIEQLVMTESPDLGRFHRQWMDEVVRQWQTKQPPATLAA